ncbi:MAG: DnaA regulatory inactivator Hda [Proteobacteria bacterium]|nr:DnaA regulatory inactivator Hda [Pseudomonadota bacterium]
MSNPIPTQLTLGVTLNDDATLENFLVNEQNQQLLNNLQSPDADGQVFYLWGKSSAGITHLLQAMCHQATAQKRGAIYLPMLQKAEFSPEILTGTNSLSLVSIDNLEALVGDPDWEAALFTEFNAISQRDTTLIIGADAPPQNISVSLADLGSRLNSALVYQLKPLVESEKIKALQLRAAKRGMQLSDAVAGFIYQRGERSMAGLMDVLQRLDDSSLTHKRPLTIPLVKATMDW